MTDSSCKLSPALPCGANLSFQSHGNFPPRKMDDCPCLVVSTGWTKGCCESSGVLFGMAFLAFLCGRWQKLSDASRPTSCSSEH